MKVMIYCPYISGHFLEYINHIYHICIKHDENQYIFVLHPGFAKVKDNMLWEANRGHILFDFLEDKEIRSVTKNNVIKSSINTARIVGRKVKQHNANKVFMPLLISATPFLPLFVSSKVRVSGIVYMIYLYRLENASIIFKLLNKLKYFIFSKSKVFDNILILNDQESVSTLNFIYGSSKFKYIPDPYIPLQLDQTYGIRKQYGISNENILYIHIGSMNENKGSKDILRSLIDAKEKDLKNKVFLFAGKVQDDIKDEFYSLLKTAKNKSKIIVIDKFCSFELFGQLCQECDAILVPYKRTSQSSGIIGYASQFRKPVIGPDTGLLGNLIKEYHLGITIKHVSSTNLVSAYKKIESGDYMKPDQSYCQSHTIDSFSKVIDNCIS